MINLWLSYPQVLALVSKWEDLGWIPWNAVQITSRQASLTLYKEGIYLYIAIWKSICCSPCSRGKIRVLFRMVFRLPSFYLSYVILESNLFSQCSIFFAYKLKVLWLFTSPCLDHSQTGMKNRSFIQWLTLKIRKRFCCRLNENGDIFFFILIFPKSHLQILCSIQRKVIHFILALKNSLYFFNIHFNTFHMAKFSFKRKILISFYFIILDLWEH